MSTGEKFEIGLIPLIGLFLWIVAPGLPDQVEAGSFLLIFSALILLQGLIRDLLKLLYSAPEPVPPQNCRETRCICLESVIGISGILLGILLTGFAVRGQVEMTRWCWSLTVMVVLATGFLIKDYVLILTPFRIYREKDRRRIRISWRK